MSLRARLTLWFLVLALVPSLFLSVFVLRQLVSTVEWWDSAGAEEALTSSVAVARSSLKRLEGGLRLSSGPLFALARQRELDLGAGSPDHLFVERYLRDTGLDFYQLYTRTAGDSTWRRTADVAPTAVVRPSPLDLAPELNDGRVAPGRPVQSVTGAFGLIEALPPDSAAGASGAAVERAAVVGYALPEDFFLRLSELQLGLGIFRRLSVYAEVYKWYFRVAVATILLLMSGVAVIAARALSRHLARPITRLAETFARVDGGTAVRVEPAGAPEVRQLGVAFNAMTARLVQARQELARAERAAAWQGVARQVAHEIKNPLTTMGLALYNIQRDAERLPPEAQARVERSLQALRRELESLDDLADSFSALGRLPEMRPAAVDLNALVESVAQVSSWEHIEIATRLDPARPVARGDERQLRRVLRNLVKNACEAQPAGGRVEIASEAARGGDPARVALVVSDDGPGIAPGLQAQMFDLGYSTKNRGTGMGLTVTRRVVEQHNGAIEVDSAPGRGTRIAIVLPAQAAPAGGGAAPAEAAT